MKKHLLLSLLLLTSFALLFTACKKDNEPSRTALMVGTWRSVSSGPDLNGNNMLDSSEVQELPAGTEILYVFRNDSTGITVATFPGQTPQSSSFNWRFLGNEAILEYTDSYTTVNLEVSKLTNTEFQASGLQDKTRFFLVWKK